MLGVIGGMGPLATADFFGKLIVATGAERDEENIPTLIHSVPQLPSRPAAILRGGESPLPALRVARDRLLAAGATMLAMPCNTAHHWYDELATDARVPFPHIADAVGAELPPEAQRIGIIATAATLAARIYEDRLDRGIEWLRPDADQFERAVQPAIDAVKRNAPADGGRMLAPVIVALRERGVSCVILACTELPVALDAIASPLRVHCIDSTAALARACVRTWRKSIAAAAIANL
ncbi:MAG TPA: amino acid racemase [Burkholderiaceae bacterium]|nr:amino acid racemase [Burkholderiaceae bacterium]HQR77350.1 amino acid racemase [Burkholderiaceae bacterium]